MELQRILAVRNDKTIYRSGDNVVKLFGSSYTKADILNEALNQARIEETGLNVPNLVEVAKIEGKWALISTYIPGKTLSTLLEENPEKKDEYLDLLIKLQLEVLSKKASLLTKLRDKLNSRINACNLSANIKYDLHMNLESMSRGTKVCHGDFNMSNIIIRESDNKPFIIDWSHATQGNGAADAARTYILMRMSHQEEMASSYLERFCQCDDIEVSYVKQWLPIVAASLYAKAPGKDLPLLHSFIDEN